MGVECREEVVCLQEPPRDRWDIGISHSASNIKKRKRVWTAIRQGSGLVVGQRMDLTIGRNEDFIASDVRRKGGNITRIVNIYNQKHTLSGERERLAQKLNWQKVIRQGCTVLTEDFNAQST
jgi:hypothetical protein